MDWKNVLLKKATVGPKKEPGSQSFPEERLFGVMLWMEGEFLV
jgi:hypothetical protein